MTPQRPQPSWFRWLRSKMRNYVCRARSVITLMRTHALKIGFISGLLTLLSAVCLLAAELPAAAAVVVTFVPIVFGGFAYFPKVWPAHGSDSQNDAGDGGRSSNEPTPVGHGPQREPDAPVRVGNH